MKDPNQEVFIIYHIADADGWSSCYTILRKYPEAHLLPYNYEANVFFLNRVPNGSLMFIVDTSFPNHIMKKLNTTMDLIWLDHHDSAIKESSKDDIVKNIKGKREIGKAACELTWEYLFPEEEMPIAVKMIGRRDVWDESYFPDAKIFEFYLTVEDLQISKIKMPKWEELYQLKDLTDIIDSYRNTYLYVVKQNEIVAKTICYEAEVLGYKCIVANRNRIGSDFFESVLKPEHDIMISWHLNKRGFFKYTFYSIKPEINVGQIVQQVTHGTKFAHLAGGHAGAAGMIFNKIIFPNSKLEHEKEI